MAEERERPREALAVGSKYMKLFYCYFISHSLYLLLCPLVLLLSYDHLPAELTLTNLLNLLQCNLSTFIICLTLPALAIVLYLTNRPRPVYLVDFACYKPGKAHKATRETIIKQFTQNDNLTAENLDFKRRILERSGIGQTTYLPESLLSWPIDVGDEMAKKEAIMMIFGAVDAILEKTKVSPKEIGVLVLNCSIYCSTPSLSAMIVNRYKLRVDVITYNLSGMGCSAGLISIDLAKQLLQVHGNSYALVVNTENMTQNVYWGNSRSMLVSNCLFRLGAAAILLSNRPSDRRRSKYMLVHTVRTQKATDDGSYNCVHQMEDEEGNTGIALSKDLMVVAGDALKTNITTLGPLILPWSEQLLFLFTMVMKKVFNLKKIKTYIPDFKLAVEHFCIHAGGRAVLDELEKNLSLSSWHMEPSRMTLYRFGNTSSSSLWYELAYSEAKKRIKNGDRVWQIAFGSGFKCNSAVWRALRTIDPEKENPWMDEIDEFPVHVPKVVSVVI